MLGGGATGALRQFAGRWRVRFKRGVVTVEDIIWELRRPVRVCDKRRGKNSHYIMADIGMAAFSPFFMQCPSFLAHQRHLADGHGHGRSNCQTLFGMTAIPSDNHV
jgi:hypothetical protein